MCMLCSYASFKSCSEWSTPRGGAAMLRQTGQLECEHSHVSMHATWKQCMHSGNLLSFSPSSNSPKHTTHVPPSSPSPETTPPSTLFRWYVCVGIICTAVEAVAGGVGWRCGGFWCVMRWYQKQMAMRWHIDTKKADKPIARRRIMKLLRKRWPRSSSMDTKLLQNEEKWLNLSVLSLKR
ncbi:uncharacterized protein LOC114168860 [Vigna unguiculata]|uniref:uncharacterized protein LOC114168860 n=1 Tax=Vigna unguiculata TaxID=3917 RepID=UPI0010170D97|nr:uncharacterized protein LOC114168860 [Vigna unguiculata]